MKMKLWLEISAKVWVSALYINGEWIYPLAIKAKGAVILSASPKKIPQRVFVLYMGGFVSGEKNNYLNISVFLCPLLPVCS